MPADSPFRHRVRPTQCRKVTTSIMARHAQILIRWQPVRNLATRGVTLHVFLLFSGKVPPFANMQFHGPLMKLPPDCLPNASLGPVMAGVNNILHKSERLVSMTRTVDQCRFMDHIIDLSITDDQFSLAKIL